MPAAIAKYLLRPLRRDVFEGLTNCNPLAAISRCSPRPLRPRAFARLASFANGPQSLEVPQDRCDAGTTLTPPSPSGLPQSLEVPQDRCDRDTTPGYSFDNLAAITRSSPRPLRPHVKLDKGGYRWRRNHSKFPKTVATISICGILLTIARPQSLEVPQDRCDLCFLRSQLCLSEPQSLEVPQDRCDGPHPQPRKNKAFQRYFARG